MTETKHNGGLSQRVPNISGKQNTGLIKRRNLIKIIVLGALILFTPISLMLGRRRRASGIYKWRDTPGENIPLPEEVSGQFQSEVCATPDGQFIAVGGHHFVPPEFTRRGGVEPAVRLMCYKYFVSVSQTFGKNFDCVYESPRSGGVATMVLSPTNPNRLAFIAVEFQKAVPDVSPREILQMIQKNRALGMEYAVALDAKDFNIVLYILDINKKESPREYCVPLTIFPIIRHIRC